MGRCWRCQLHYADTHADAGLALAIGGGFDIRLSKKVGLRAAMDYDPTFLVRPVFPDLTPDAEGHVTVLWQDRGRAFCRFRCDGAEVKRHAFTTCRAARR